RKLCVYARVCCQDDSGRRAESHRALRQRGACRLPQQVAVPFMQLLLDAAYATAVFTLVSLGLFVIMGLMNIINLAHASFMALSVYSLLTAIDRGMGFLPAAALALSATLVVG